MVPAALEAAIRADRARGLRPFLAVANAGTTNTGAIDPLPAIADVCATTVCGCTWTQRTAASSVSAPGGERSCPGFERADSLILDPHKGLFLPYGTGCLLLRDPEALQRAHTVGAGYLQDLEQPAERSISLTARRNCHAIFGAYALAAVMLYGVEAIRDNLREKLELARWASEELRAPPASSASTSRSSPSWPSGTCPSAGMRTSSIPRCCSA